jgi:aspartyl-tRNA(Asn)/glutamyl-tRNA(Gln) amidotransferase subunit C
MSLSRDDILRLANLARIDLVPLEVEQIEADLNNIFGMVEALQAIDTSGVAPLSHPLATIRAMQLGLRDDRVTEVDQREANLANAPQREDGLFLVPKVIE